MRPRWSPRGSAGAATSELERGKSRFNALKSGIHAESQAIPGEDAAELEALAEEYRREFRPHSRLAVFLVDAMLRADWKLRRLQKIETQLWRRRRQFGPSLQRQSGLGPGAAPDRGCGALLLPRSQSFRGRRKRPKPRKTGSGRSISGACPMKRPCPRNQPPNWVRFYLFKRERILRSRRSPR